MNICIGIISYLPSDEKIRAERIRRVTRLIRQCDEFFGLPIILIAQNYRDSFQYIPSNSKLIIYNFKSRLGITGARNYLRNIFLESSFDRIILLDDDLELSGKSGADEYLSKIKNKEIYCIPGWLTLYACISKEGFSKVGYDANINPENNTGFEDWLFWEKCRRYLTFENIKSSLPKGKRSNYLNDNYSTWESKVNRETNKRINNSKTMIEINKLKGK